MVEAQEGPHQSRRRKNQRRGDRKSPSVASIGENVVACRYRFPKLGEAVRLLVLPPHCRAWLDELIRFLETNTENGEEPIARSVC